MKKLTLAGLAIFALAAPNAASAAPRLTVTITHVMRGCHAWDLGHGAMQPTMSLTVRRGTVVKFVNNDVMPHKLVSTSGPGLAIKGGNMSKMAATASTTFMRPGVYRFKTVWGAFFPWAASMAAEIKRMDALRLTIRVK